MVIKKNYDSICKFIALLSLLPMLMAVKNKSDSILDRLERRLLNKEQEALSFGEKSLLKNSQPQQKMNFKEALIDEFSPSAKDMKKLDEAIRELEAQVEYLANGVHAAKQKIIKDAGIKNNILISTLLETPANTAFRSLRVKIDGHEIYEQNSSLGLWLPQKRIPLFDGPMQPGKHRIDYEAIIVQKEDKVLAISQDRYHKVMESFHFDVPAGQTQKQWEITLKPGQAESAVAKAQFKAVK